MCFPDPPFPLPNKYTHTHPHTSMGLCIYLYTLRYGGTQTVNPRILFKYLLYFSKALPYGMYFCFRETCHYHCKVVFVVMLNAGLLKC